MGPEAESGKAASDPGNNQNLHFIFLSYIAISKRLPHTFKGNSGLPWESSGELTELVGRWRGRARMRRTQLVRTVLSGRSHWHAWIWCCLWGMGGCPCLTHLRWLAVELTVPNFYLVVCPSLELREGKERFHLNVMKWEEDRSPKGDQSCCWKYGEWTMFGPLG